MILELTWPTGRLVREYTLLFDPPAACGDAPALTAAPTTSPARHHLPRLESPAEQRRTRAPPPRRRAGARYAALSRVQQPRPRPGRAAADADEYKVKAGDSLSRIAARTQRPGVSLDQMLNCPLYPRQPAQLIENNMNRLKVWCRVGRAQCRRSTKGSRRPPKPPRSSRPRAPTSARTANAWPAPRSRRRPKAARARPAARCKRRSMTVNVAPPPTHRQTDPEQRYRGFGRRQRPKTRRFRRQRA